MQKDAQLFWKSGALILLDCKKAITLSEQRFKSLRERL
jgi:hypothetical protein